MDFDAAASASMVALLAEGVDRNPQVLLMGLVIWYVALLAEGVDRNAGAHSRQQGGRASPSSRRAWIEIWSELNAFL